MTDYGIYEHVVMRERGKGAGVLRIFLAVLTCLGVLGLLWMGLIFRMFFLFLAIAIVAAFAAFVFLRKYSSVEYEYSIADGRITFSEILGKRARRVMQDFDIRKCVMIVPADDARIADYGAADTYYAVSSAEAPGIYCAAFESDKGKRTVVYFEATEKALKILRSWNPSAMTLWRAI